MITILFCLVAVALSQLSPFLLPPDVNFINSAFTEKISNNNVPQGSVEGTFAFSKEIEGFFVSVPSQNFTEWFGQSEDGSIDVWAVINGQCTKFTITIPSVNCGQGWRKGADGTWVETCAFQAGPQTGNLVARVKTANAQVSQMVQSTEIVPNKVVAEFKFANSAADNKPADPSVFTPPANCTELHKKAQETWRNLPSGSLLKRFLRNH